MGFLKCTDYSLNSHFICTKQEKELLSIEYILLKSDETFVVVIVLLLTLLLFLCVHSGLELI